MLAGGILGVAAGPPPVIVAAVALPLSWASALAFFLARRARAFVAAVALSFAVSAWVLAAVAEREARYPPLLARWQEASGEGPLRLEGRLRADASVGSGGIGLDLKVLAIGVGGASTSTSTSGGARVTVSGEMAAKRAGEWRAGRTVRLPAQLREATRYRDPGVADGRLALARRGTILVGSAKSAALVETTARGAWCAEAAASARAMARRVVLQHVGRWSGRSAAIVIAILIGDRAGLDEEVERRLQEAGTYHVIAISGGNIAILAALILGGLRLLGAGHRVSAVAGILILGAYAFTVGGGGSVVRATLMAVLLLAAGLGDYRTAPLNALAVAGAVVLAATPLSLLDVGCALTFGATLGILVGGSRFLGSPRRASINGQQPPGASRQPAKPGSRPPPSQPAPWLRWPLALLMASICAELALFPVSAFSFSRVTFAGLLLNFAAIPLMTIVQVAGMLVIPLAAVHGGAASAAGWVAHAAAEGLISSAALVEWWPWLSYRLPPPHPLALVTYYASWAAWFALAALRRRRHSSKSVESSKSAKPVNQQPNKSSTQQLTMTVLIVLSGLWILVEPVTLLVPGVSGVLRVTFLDVGHADAVLVQLPDRRSLLVDTGGSLTGSSFDIGGRVLAPALWRLGTRRLDTLVLSHGDPDHVGGAASVIRDFQPREIWEGIPVPPNARLQALRRQAGEAGASWRTCLQGERGSFGEVSWRVWHPPPADWERQHVRNDDSIVLELRYGDVSVLLPGDIGRPVEQELAGLIPPAPLRVVKVPHHGSASSSTAAFVSALQPRVAVLSAGATTKVSDAALARYRDAGAALFRTDRDGAVILTTDGHTVTVRTFTGVTAVFGPG